MNENVKPLADKPQASGASTKGTAKAKAGSKKDGTDKGSAKVAPTKETPHKAAAKPQKPTAVKDTTKANPDVQPVAGPARMKRRHWSGIASFFGFVLAPLTALSLYLWIIAADQYASTAGFTVRSEEGGFLPESFGGLVQLAGGGGAADGDILFEYIQSQEIVSAVDAKLNILDHYSSGWPRDFLFSIWPDATLEELNWFWQRFVRLSYDKSSGLIEVQVLAFEPEMAQKIALEIVAHSQNLINNLSTQAREDAMRYARRDVEETIRRLKEAREALTEFRTRTQILDPAADIQGRVGLLQSLQQQLAQTLIEHDMLRETVSENDPRIAKLQRLISVIRERIASEGQTYSSARTTGTDTEDYPKLLAEYESLVIDQKFAEETYRASLAALDIARQTAARESRYLAVYIPPTQAQKSEYPRRFVLLGLTTMMLLLVWATLALVYYSIRDRG